MENYKANEAKLKSISDKIWGKIDGIHIKENKFGKGKVFCEMTFNEVFAKLNINPDFSYIGSSKSSNVQFIHKRLGQQDVYFISNQNDYPEELICTFRVHGKAPEIWNPENGTTQKLGIYKLSSNETTLPVRLEGKGSVFVVFSKKSENPVVSLSRNNVSLFPVFNQHSSFAQTPNYFISEDSAKQWTLSKSGVYDFQLDDCTKHSLNVPAIPSDLILYGKWMVSFQKGRNAPEKVEFDSLIALNNHLNPQIKYFSGIATYTKEINLSIPFFEQEKELILELGELHDMASVKINGRELGVVWIKPYQINLTKVLKPGNNIIEIEIANSWANRIIGDLQLPKNDRITWSNSLNSFSGGESITRYTLPNRLW